MFGALFIGLSGMQAYSSGLRQVSNNITNLNTLGYKGSDVRFSDVFSDPGMGANQLGYGVTLSDQRLDFGQGDLRETDNDLDLAVDGEGFMVLLDGQEPRYIRTGSFQVNSEGYIVLSGTDYRLSVLDEEGNPQALSIDGYRSNPPAETTRIRFAENLSSTATEYNLPDVTVFNAEGEGDTWKVRFSRPAGGPAGEWEVEVTNGSGDVVGTQALKFNNGIIDPTTTQLDFTDASEGRSVVLDFGSNVTSFSSGEVSTLRAAEVDGYGLGQLIAIAVNATGDIELRYSNEQSHVLGAVSLATFQDPSVLQQMGGGLFKASSTKGLSFLSSESAKTGSVLSRRVEASNIDLSQQFGDLILLQRGYQASSQVVSVSNDMIQQLFGLRGQG